MSFLTQSATLSATLAILAFFIYRPAMLRKHYASPLSLKSWIIAAAQIWLCFQNVYAIAQILQIPGPIGQRQIVSLVFVTFNAVAWVFFLLRDIADYFSKRRTARRTAYARSVA